MADNTPPFEYDFPEPEEPFVDPFDTDWDDEEMATQALEFQRLLDDVGDEN